MSEDHAPSGLTATRREPDAGQTAETLLEIRDLQKVYAGRRQQVQALADVNLTVQKGEFISIVGASGCGKSTLLKIVAGLEPKSGGTVQLHGSEVTGPSRRIGMMFQTPVLFGWRTVLENVLLPIEVLHYPREKYLPRARAVLQLVGLANFADSYPRELSGGMQQRAALSRLLTYEPEVMLLDEPFGALDEFTREALDLELQRLWLEQGLTMALVTHNIGEAVLLSDRVAVMSSSPGRIRTIIDIDLPRPRSMDILKTPRYAELLFSVRESLGLGH